jgi:RimJ/RimL family protein N-acetyltransferase
MARDEDARTIPTARLRLAAAGRSDLETVALLLSDERVWRHFPSGRHTDIEQTRAYLANCERQWQRDRLGHWVARLAPASVEPCLALAYLRHGSHRDRRGRGATDQQGVTRLLGAEIREPDGFSIP